MALDHNIDTRLLDRFASRADVSRLEGKVDAISGRLDGHADRLVRTELVLEAIRDILLKIAWLLATPLVLGSGSAAIYFAGRSMGFWG
jgi:hypothetical protein